MTIRDAGLKKEFLEEAEGYNAFRFLSFQWGNFCRKGGSIRRKRINVHDFVINLANLSNIINSEAR